MSGEMSRGFEIISRQAARASEKLPFQPCHQPTMYQDDDTQFEPQVRLVSRRVYSHDHRISLRSKL